MNGIAQWVRFDLDRQHRYENMPVEGAISAFAVMFHPLMRPIEMAPANALRFAPRIIDSELHIWAQSPEVE